MLGLELNPMPRTMVAHFKGSDASEPPDFPSSSTEKAN